MKHDFRFFSRNDNHFDSLHSLNYFIPKIHKNDGVITGFLQRRMHIVHTKTTQRNQNVRCKSQKF